MYCIHHSGDIIGLGTFSVQLLSGSVTGLGVSGLDSSRHLSWLVWHCVEGEGKPSW